MDHSLERRMATKLNRCNKRRRTQKRDIWVLDVEGDWGVENVTVFWWSLHVSIDKMASHGV